MRAPLLKFMCFAGCWLGGAAPGGVAADQISPGSHTISSLLALPREHTFKSVIEATTGHRVLNLYTNQPSHRALMERLYQAAAQAGHRARQAGIAAERANEAGLGMDAFVRDALARHGLNARTPITTRGTARSAGYPDLEIPGDPHAYLELKTFSADTAGSSQRTFYYSPSPNPKVTRDALHLLLGYELEKETRGGRSVFVPMRWELLTLENLVVDLKLEFNQSNRGLYNVPGATLGQGLIEPAAGTTPIE